MSLSILFYKKRKSGPGSPRWLGFTEDGTSKGLSLGSPAIQKELSALPPPKKKKNKLQGRCGKKRLETGRALLTVQSWGIQAQGGPPILGCLACSWLIHPSFPARQFILEASTTVWQRKGITPGKGSLSPWLDSGESSSPQLGKERRATQTPDSQLGPPRGEGQPCPRQ